VGKGGAPVKGRKKEGPKAGHKKQLNGKRGDGNLVGNKRGGIT